MSADPPASSASEWSNTGDTASTAVIESTTSTSTSHKKKKRELTPLFWYMELGEWDKATERVRRHPREVKKWVDLKTKSTMTTEAAAAAANIAADGSSGTSSGTKRLALHHACFKLRSAGSAPPPSSTAAVQKEDPFLQVCRFILLLLRLYPEAASQRESRHGCLPLHLAAFASCAPRSSTPSAAADREDQQQQQEQYPVKPAAASRSSSAPRATQGAEGAAADIAAGTAKPAVATRSITTGAVTTTATTTTTDSAAAGGGDTATGALARPGIISRRVASDATTGTIETVQTNMSAIHAEETYTGGMSDNMMSGGGNNGNGSGGRGHRRCSSSSSSNGAGRPTNKKSPQPLTDPNVSVAAKYSTTMSIPAKREEMAVQVINALLDAYPKGIRVDSEGGRLPLHTACAGRATPRIMTTLVTAYPSAARHRNKDGFLPLHLAAHWGVSHPNVAVTLLKAYPDATLGRNRWERTPLEEALCMAGENGRPHQGALVRALRKHPSYWTHPPPMTNPAAAAGRGGRGGAARSRTEGHYRRRSGPVDVDESLPSSDSAATDEERRYLQYGHEFLVDPDEELDKEEKKAPAAPAASPSFISRLSSPFKVGKKKEQEELAMGTSLAWLIQKRKWEAVLMRLEANPLEGKQYLEVMTRGGFVASSGMSPLHYACERKPPVEVVLKLISIFPAAVLTRAMPGGALPLHLACTWYGSADVVWALVAAEPCGARITDELGDVPLHSACFSGADVQVIEALLDTYGKAVLARNKQGSRPIDICKRLRHENRDAVISLLTLKKEAMMTGHRRNHSSGSWSVVASEASELNERQGVPRRTDRADGYIEGDDLHDHHGVGIEVTYNADENEGLNWI